MKRLGAITATAVVVATAITPAAVATSAPASAETKIQRSVTLPNGKTATNVPERWFVKLAGPSVAKGGDAATIRRSQDAFNAQLRTDGIDASVTTKYEKLWNGVAIDASAAELEKIAKLGVVEQISPVVEVPRPAPIVDKAKPAKLTPAQIAEGIATPSLFHAKEQGGVLVGHNGQKYTGKNTTIAIIDTGVDYDHPDLGGNGKPSEDTKESPNFPNNKVIGGYDFVGDDFTGGFLGRPSPDPYPDDCAGHGTHVAGIAAAKKGQADGINGVAPDAKIRAYRIFGCNSNTTAELITKAMEKAAEDGVDIVNMSIGTDYMIFADYPTAVAAAELTKKGITVIVAQGNVGDKGRWTMGGAGTSSGVITVGSVDNAKETNHFLTMTGKDGFVKNKIPYGIGEGAAVLVVPHDTDVFPVVEAAPAYGKAELAKDDPALLCSAPKENAFKDKAVIVRRGGDEKKCNFRTKAFNAQAGGAKMLIIDNNKEGTLSVSVMPEKDRDELVQIPVVSVSLKDGNAMRAALQEGSEITFPTGHQEFEVATAGEVSEFSSWGLNSNLELKPDVVAPGGRIWSTWPLTGSLQYQTVSGTSMAAPFVAGAAALILEAHPEIRTLEAKNLSNAVAERLRTTAKPVAWHHGKSELEPMARQGAGLVNVGAAIEANISITPSVLNLGQAADVGTDKALNKHTVTVRNNGATRVVYTLLHRDAVTITGPGAKPEKNTAASAAKVSTDGTEITLEPKASVELEVVVTPPTGMKDGDFYGGFITFTPKGDGQALSIPFSGVGGDMAKADVLGLANGGKVELKNRDFYDLDPTVDAMGHNDYTNTGMYTDPARFSFEPNVPVEKIAVDVAPVAKDGTVGTPLGLSLTDILAADGGLAEFVKGVKWSSSRPVHGKVDPSQRFRSAPAWFSWDGSYIDKDKIRRQAPSGKYQITMYVLPVGEKGTSIEDWYAWTAPQLRIDWDDAYFAPTEGVKVLGGKAGDEAVMDSDAFTSVAVEGRKATHTIDLGKEMRLDTVTYIPDQLAPIDRATSWTVEYSLDNKTWEELGKRELLTFHQYWSRMGFQGATKARYLRVTLENSQEDATRVSVADIRVTEARPDAPDATPKAEKPEGEKPGEAGAPAPEKTPGSEGTPGAEKTPGKPGAEKTPVPGKVPGTTPSAPATPTPGSTPAPGNSATAPAAPAAPTTSAPSGTPTSAVKTHVAAKPTAGATSQKAGTAAAQPKGQAELSFTGASVKVALVLSLIALVIGGAIVMRRRGEK
ncbi:subtilisin family serine protease [Arcanobacterium wilhelmae]|uniref:Subtilisin family serine protease n=2 Tax=Arcanobacterium wilhelmae TaxID=1803177 RepID=A0ABT9NE24_9ACTO|nr:subtilisin family serine protease [Arcanobacterium wilhelmae]